MEMCSRGAGHPNVLYERIGAGDKMRIAARRLAIGK
jgi:hypothetical protein